jgi:radical SAM protein with 4Fe4S-binding SPASM domain
MTTELLREIDLHLTNRCNLTCAHCSVDSGKNRSSWGEMSVSEWTEVVRDAARLGCRYTDLTGGEPVLYAGVERLIQHILETGMNLELQSNGILLTVEKLRRLREAGLATLVISLDGTRDQHDSIRGQRGAYAQAVQAIRDGVAMGFQVRVTRVITSQEAMADLQTFAQELDSIGVSHLSLNLFSPVTPAHFAAYRKIDPALWLRFIHTVEGVAAGVAYPITYEVAYARPDELPEFLQDETRCLIQRRRWFLIRSDGEVFPCYHFVHRPEMSIGNVRSAPLSALIEDGCGRWDRYDQIRHIPHDCSACRFAPTCGGGCPSPGYLNFGSLSIKDIRCEVERGYLPICPFVKRKAGTRHMTNIAPYYA